MGKITTKELANGNIGLEITYGGADAPFGGVDTSAPPAYIDPRCFVQADGAIVVDNKLCAIALESTAMPQLWSGTANVILIGFGTFYNSIYGQLNYALGYIATTFGGPPSGVSYAFYMTSWQAGNTGVFYNDVLNLDLYNASTPAVAASLTLPCIPSSSTAPVVASGATGNITAVNSVGNVTAATLTGGAGYGVGDAVQLVPNGTVPTAEAWVTVTVTGGGGSITTVQLAPNTGLGNIVGAVTAGAVEAVSLIKLKVNASTFTVNGSSSSATPASIASAMASNITGGPDTNAVVSVDGVSIILTAKTPGAAGNATTVQDLSTGQVAGSAPPFYFPAKTVINLQGGADAINAPAPTSFGTVTKVDVGGTVYFGNLGPIILKYSGSGKLAISSMYQGVTVLGKFAGSLLGLGVIPQLGFSTQNQDMILAWTAGGKLDIWAPIDGSGNVTGAGFEQLADVGDFLSGLIVSNGTVFILRKEGVSYATATGNGIEPFTVNHIGLGSQGEGAQIPSLVAQYDSVGCYIGNSNVWQLTGSISPVGDKVKSAIFKLLQGTIAPALLTSAAGAVYIGGDEYPIAVFVLGSTIYIFNTGNGTWSTLSIPSFATSNILIASAISSANIKLSTGQYGQVLIGLIAQNLTNGIYEAPTLHILTEQLADNNSASLAFSVTFPEEEIAFGRDVTIDALYIALQASLQVNVTLNIYLNGILYAAYVLQAASFTNVDANPIEFQVFPSIIASGISTGHSPQLKLQLVNQISVNSCKARFTKVSMFGSIDAAQRPV